MNYVDLESLMAFRSGGADNPLLDSRTAAGGEVRQVVSLADPSVSENVLAVDSTGKANVLNTPATPLSYTLNSANTVNATSVKAAPGVLYALNVSNSGGAAVFVKLFNKASAPTVGTDTPILIVPVGASAVTSLVLGPLGSYMSAGIAFAITNLIASSDTTVVTAGAVKIWLSYL